MARLLLRASSTLCVFVVLTVSCASAGNESGTDVGETSSTPASVAVSDPPTDELPATTTEEEPVASVDEDVVREVHTRFMTELFERDEAFAGVEAMRPLVEELTTGEEQERLLAGIALRVEEGGWIVSAGYQSNIVTVDLDLEADPATAVVSDCSRNRAFVWGPANEQVESPEEDWSLRESELVREADGRWLVTSFTPDPGDRCDEDGDRSP